MKLHNNFWVPSEAIEDVLRWVTADVNEPIEVCYRNVGRVEVYSSVRQNQSETNEVRLRLRKHSNFCVSERIFDAFQRLIVQVKVYILIVDEPHFESRLFGFPFDAFHCQLIAQWGVFVSRIPKHPNDSGKSIPRLTVGVAD